MSLFLLLLKIGPMLGQECYDDGNEFCIDKNDILSVDLLPGSFLFFDQNRNDNKSQVVENAIVLDGTYDNALNQMNYHRAKMNEYLCHGYLAEEIFHEIGSPRVKRGPDWNSHKIDSNHFEEDDNVTMHDKLLSDEGSSKYKNWLQKTTTLDDVYRHYAPNRRISKKHGSHHSDGIEEFDGEVTGYAMQAPLPIGKVGYFGPTGDDHGSEHIISSPSGLSHYGGGHRGEYFPPIHHEEHYHPGPAHHEFEEEHYKPIYIREKGHHELSIKDFFEIALTALAFLAFGLFIIQLLMNATNHNNMTPAIMTEATRFRRHTDTFLNYPGSNKNEINELAHRVLRSIEAVLIANNDAGNCLRRNLCEDNQFSKETKDSRRIWIPVWSLGMSWLSGRVLVQSPWSAMLDSVKASVLGLGGADCASLYPKCDLRKERIKRRRRRRK